MGVKFVVPNFDAYTKKALPFIEQILNSNMVTNHNFVEEFEKSASKYLGTGTMATSSCTSSMIMCLRALNLHKTEIIVPSFTFCATAHAAYWNDCKIVFADMDPETFNINVEDVKQKITPNTKAILATHVFGNPCDIKALTDITQDKKIHLAFDAAHAFGGSYQNKKIGSFGVFEAFSLSPTKLLSSLEGGIVASSDDKLLNNIKLARAYGSPSDYNCPFQGLNARMTEINALVGKLMLEDLDKYVENRNKYAQHYIKKLKDLPGISFQKIEANSTSTFKDFAIIIDEKAFGMNRNQVAEQLYKKGIETKKYFYPPVHKMTAYNHYNDLHLKHTAEVSQKILCIPIHNIMTEETLNSVSDSIIELCRK